MLHHVGLLEYSLLNVTKFLHEPKKFPNVAYKEDPLLALTIKREVHDS